MATDPGSSPRVRGKPFQRFGRRSDCRIIPARAGQTRFLKPDTVMMSDHPRACGANSLFVFLFFLLFGSSPRVRGKLGIGDIRRRQRRIIPARAGQT